VRGYVAVGESQRFPRVRKEFYGGVNVWNHPADLGEFKSGDGVVDTIHVCCFLMLEQFINGRVSRIKGIRGNMRAVLDSLHVCKGSF
jgi:hypothetical protein